MKSIFMLEILNVKQIIRCHSTPSRHREREIHLTQEGPVYRKEEEKPVERSRFHTLEADFKRPLYRIKEKTRACIRETLTSLYGKRKAERYLPEFERILRVYHAYKTKEMIEWEKGITPADRFTEQDAVLITYGDLVKDEHRKPLQTLLEISTRYLRGVFNTIHILPFFPYSSDRGFAVMDFRQIDPNLGQWADINRMKDDFKLMFDGVFNHISARSFWFQEFLNGNKEYDDFFTVFSEKRKVSKARLRKLMRPRTSSVLTEFYTYHGKKYVWTTFSPDQIDLKFQNPKVLLKMTEILLYYVRRGADLVRLDAVTYLWDEPGTTGAHLWQTHAIIKLFRKMLDEVAPHVALITETNVPHEDNISYFGDGHDEAQMVYNFALPPLVLHTMHTGNVERITRWLDTLKNPSPAATFFNFLDSHDGIGLLGARGILTDEEIRSMADNVTEHGGLISYRTEPDGSESPYELNITSYSAMNLEGSREDVDIQVRRYLAARSIPLVIVGVPGVYLHGLLGSKNDIEAIRKGHEKRSINRNIILRKDLEKALLDENTTARKVSFGLSRLIHKRICEKAFHPQGPQKVLFLNDGIFSVLRTSPDGEERIIALTNVTGENQSVVIDIGALGCSVSTWKDIAGKREFRENCDTISLKLRPYQVCWLKGVS